MLSWNILKAWIVMFLSPTRGMKAFFICRATYEALGHNSKAVEISIVVYWPIHKIWISTNFWEEPTVLWVTVPLHRLCHELLIFWWFPTQPFVDIHVCGVYTKHSWVCKCTRPTCSQYNPRKVRWLRNWPRICSLPFWVSYVAFL